MMRRPYHSHIVSPPRAVGAFASRRESYEVQTFLNFNFETLFCAPARQKSARRTKEPLEALFHNPQLLEVVGIDLPELTQHKETIIRNNQSRETMSRPIFLRIAILIAILTTTSATASRGRATPRRPHWGLRTNDSTRKAFFRHHTISKRQDLPCRSKEEPPMLATLAHHTRF